ncbi:MAG: hypothetical protein ACRDIB_16145 [Ardenticatenaceae bacterium]
MAFCACGCGEATAGGLFKQGHDQRLRTRLEERAGGLVALSRLVDAAEDFANGRLDPELFAQQVRRQFGR